LATESRIGVRHLRSCYFRLMVSKLRKLRCDGNSLAPIIGLGRFNQFAEFRFHAHHTEATVKKYKNVFYSMTKNRGGRPAYKPTDKDRSMVKTMAGYGIPQPDISRVLKIDIKTLRKHFREELDTGHITATTAMAQNLYKKAMGDGPAAVTASIFWLKARAGWNEKAPVDDSDKGLTIRVVGGLPEPSRD